MKLKFNACPKCPRRPGAAAGHLRRLCQLPPVRVAARPGRAPPGDCGAGRRRRPGTRRQGPHPRPPRGSPESRLTDTADNTPEARQLPIQPKPRQLPIQPKPTPTQAAPPPDPGRRRNYPGGGVAIRPAAIAAPAFPLAFPHWPDLLGSYSSFRRQPESGHSHIYRHPSTPTVIPAPQPSFRRKPESSAAPVLHIPPQQRPARQTTRKIRNFQ